MEIAIVGHNNSLTPVMKHHTATIPAMLSSWYMVAKLYHASPSDDTVSSITLHTLNNDTVCSNMLHTPSDTVYNTILNTPVMIQYAVLQCIPQVMIHYAVPLCIRCWQYSMQCHTADTIRDVVFCSHFVYTPHKTTLSDNKTLHLQWWVLWPYVQLT